MANLGMSAGGFSAAVNAFKAVKSGWNGDTRYIVAVGAEYGAYVEFGTSSNAAQPYLFPAAETVLQSEFDRHAENADNVDDLVRQLALAMEREAKSNAPVDTGNLRSSIEAFPADARP